MSVAAPSQTENKSVAAQAGLWTTGLVGGVYVLAALAVVFYGIPQLWEMSIGPWLADITTSKVAFSLRVIVQAAASVFLVMFGISLAGPNPPKGIRGSIFFGISIIFTAFFLARGALTAVERLMKKVDAGQIVALLFIGFLVYVFYKFLASDRYSRWSIALESSGWFDAKSYKGTQGLRVRRLTILGFLIVFGAGIWTMVHNKVITANDWVVSLPFANTSITLLADAPTTVPFLLGCLAAWFAWRIVNYPVFADFLIATEAEINKVSWTPRARLIQDTIVVLATLVIITFFLFVVDLFWAKSLSAIGIIPSGTDSSGEPSTSKQENPEDK